MIDSTLTASGYEVSIPEPTAMVSTSFARPAGTTAYTAKDAVADSASAPTVLTFTKMANKPGGTGYITKARLMSDQSGNTARFRLHLFHTAPTPINDNAAHTLLYANRANRVGHVDFDAMQTEGSGSTAANASNTAVRLPFACAAGSRDLFGLLETLDAFTPASAQAFHLELTAERPA